MAIAQEIIELEQKYILQTYRRPGFVLERGEGVYLYDTEDWSRLPFREFIKYESKLYDKEYLKQIKHLIWGLDPNAFRRKADYVEVFWAPRAPLIFWPRGAEVCAILAPLVSTKP